MGALFCFAALRNQNIDLPNIPHYGKDDKYAGDDPSADVFDFCRSLKPVAHIAVSAPYRRRQKHGSQAKQNAVR